MVGKDIMTIKVRILIERYHLKLYGRQGYNDNKSEVVDQEQLPESKAGSEQHDNRNEDARKEISHEAMAGKK
jgi:hypothetical protein